MQTFLEEADPSRRGLAAALGSTVPLAVVAIDRTLHRTHPLQVELLGLSIMGLTDVFSRKHTCSLQLL